MNKFKYILSITFTLIALQGFSQFHFGFKLGGSSASVTGIKLESFKPTQKTYFHGGGVVNYTFARFITLQTEVLYTGKGTAFSYYAENQVYRGQVEMDQRLGYLAIPLILQLNFGSDPRSNFHISGGIVNNFLVYDKFSGTIAVEDAGQVVVKDFTFPHELNKKDLGYAFGVGLLANGIIFDFRYEQGTKSIYADSEENPDLRNRVFMVSIGYLF